MMAPWTISASDVTAFLGGYLIVLFVALSVAVGIFYLAELVEEHTRLTIQITKYAIGATAALHAVLLIVDRLPLVTMLVSVTAQGTYFRLLKSNFPFVSSLSEPVLTSLCAFATSQYCWYGTFTTRWADAPVDFSIGFMIVVSWLVPLTLLISVSSADAVLPHGAPSAAPSGSQRRGVVLQVLDAGRNFFKAKAKRALPQTMHQRLD
ncbi:transmembrane adaptor Erv26 [Pycnococcus provasolii]